MASCTSPPPSMRTLPASRLTSSASSALRAVSTAPTAAIASARSGHRPGRPRPLRLGRLLHGDVDVGLRRARAAR